LFGQLSLGASQLALDFLSLSRHELLGLFAKCGMLMLDKGLELLVKSGWVSQVLVSDLESGSGHLVFVLFDDLQEGLDRFSVV
jgi:hypothetical protein